MHIRKASLYDAPQIARLATELGYRSTAVDINNRLDQLMGRADRYIAVADAGDEKILGWIAVEKRLLLESGEKAEIVGLIVTGQSARQGVGAALVKAAEKWAARRGLEHITVRSNAEREGSHPFYEAQGYVRRKTQHVYLKSLSSNKS
ncbi:GNAT family N-acetyltransferase [Marinobacter fonticola]|uniref:GNAT family N-acetyltransferase n=1 Tax=Marinobacter fonticola TaxID=2603215 RepID=UPI0011E731FC|nr:GNAT family N-acetyltransferase [Marinobacter fonticola]